MPLVYFIKPVGMDGPVKIGCSRSPSGRLSALMTWAPFPLEIAATCPGNLKVERSFHALFAASHSHREWFHPSAALTAAIASVAAGTFDFSTLPDPKLVTAPKIKVISEKARRTMRPKMRVSRHFFQNGFRPSQAVEDALALLNRDGLGDAEYDQARRVIDEQCADPEQYGTPNPYPWAEKSRAEFRDRRARSRATKRAA